MVGQKKLSENSRYAGDYRRIKNKRSMVFVDIGLVTLFYDDSYLLEIKTIALLSVTSLESEYFEYITMTS